jgi:dipeptidyl-peptidase-4
MTQKSEMGTGSGDSQGSPSGEIDQLLFQYAITNKFRSGRPTSIKIGPDGRGVFFLRSGPRDSVQSLYEHDPQTGQEHCLLNVRDLLTETGEQLSDEERARRERARESARGLVSYQLSPDGDRVLVPLNGQLYLLERASGAITKLTDDGGSPLDARFSPDGKQVACVRGRNLFVIDLSSNQQLQLTHSTSPTVVNGLPEFVAQEEMHRFEGYWWSPDSKSIAYEQFDESKVESRILANIADPGAMPFERKYPRAGTTNAVVRLGVINSSGGETLWIEWDSHVYPYLATVRWQPNAPLTFVVQNRAQTEEVIQVWEPESRQPRSLHCESDAAWLNLYQEFLRWLDDGSGFLWVTERSGWPQIELRNTDGTLVRAVTDLKTGFRRLVHVDCDKRIVWIQASLDPTRMDLVGVSLDTGRSVIASEQTDLPSENDAWFGKSFDWMVHQIDYLERRSQWFVRQRNEDGLGPVVSQLNCVSEQPLLKVRREFVRVGEAAKFYGSIIRPSFFEPGMKFPTIVYVYGGPCHQTVRVNRVSYPLDQWIAEHGFVVISIDGRGTPGRGREWERAIRSDLATLPLEDQVAGLNCMAQRFPEIDLSNVGIFGWSFGGYLSSMAVMRRPDIFQAAVSGAPVCDFREYDTHYTERYLGIPDAETSAYDASSLLTFASSLNRPLLLIHGTSDDNCYFSGTLRFSDALFRAGKEHLFLPLLGQTHMVVEPAVMMNMYKRMIDFFVSQLLLK